MHSSILRFVVFMGGLEVGVGKFVASRPPLTRCAGAPLEGEPLGGALMVAFLFWGWSCPPGHPSVTFGDSVPPLALRATSPVSGESVLEGEPLGAALMVAPLEGSLRLSKKCIVGASSARP